ncbi:MAG: hypothetical protein FJ255_05445 [Phycisphaerae bacterium]|nr:hypothetical protein [Phycisphaerae bacterium]
MRTPLAAILLTAGTALAQNSVAVDLTGVSISSLSTNPPDVVRTSTATISPATGYLYAFNPIVRGTGLLGSLLIPTPTPLGDVLNTFVPGSYRTVFGAMRNPAGTLPARVTTLRVSGTFSGLSINLDLELSLLADGRAQAAIRRINKPIGLGLNVESGAATATIFLPNAPVVSEWHFDGDLRSVRQTGLAPASGPGLLRYLDDPAFGPILGGPGNTTTLPSPPTPHNITQAQSTFAPTSFFSIPPIAGNDATVYRVSPPRNAADPGNRTLSRGIGLALWPNTRDTWPDDKIGHWTFVWDLLIPASSFSTEWAAALIEDNHNNDEQADALIRMVAGAPTFGYQVQPGQYLATPAIQPDTWVRLALVSDGYRSGTGRVYANGALVGSTSGDWVYNSTKSTDPRFGDISTAQPLGTPVPAAQWNAWEQFPSPWAQAPNPTAAPMASTICLFADLMGRGEAFYVANMAFVDDTLTPAQVAALAGPDHRGIFFHELPPCPGQGPGACSRADWNEDGVIDFNDLLGFLNDFNALDPCADLNGDGVVDFNDFLEFLNIYNAGC